MIFSATTPTSSSANDAAEIRALTSQVQRSQNSADFWNRWSLWILYFTAVAACITCLIQFKANKAGKALAEVQARLIGAKDRQLSADLKSKDLQIASLSTEASKAQLSAEEANKRAKELGRSNLLLRGDLEKASAELRKQNLQTEERLTEAKRVLGQEQDKRLSLENSLAPRRITFKEYVDGTANTDGLKEFAGIEAIIQFIPDFEAQHAAHNIAFLLEEVKWKRVSFQPAPEAVFDGITIESYYSPDDQQRKQRSSRAAEALEKFLLENNWAAMSREAVTDELKLGQGASGQVKISVGYKPLPYFQDPLLKAVMEAHEKDLGIDRAKPPKAIRREYLASPAGLEIYRVGNPNPPRE